MTVGTEVSQVDFNGTGLVVDFDVPFPILAEEHLVVTLKLAGAALAIAQVLGTHYSVSGVGDPECRVTMLAAPAAGSVLHVERTVPVVQDTSYRTQGPFTAASHEDQADYDRMVDQQIIRRVAALEALGSLVSLGDLELLLLDVDLLTDADDAFDTFPATVVLPVGFLPTGVWKVKCTNADAPGTVNREAVDVDWTAISGELTLRCVTGLEPATNYVLRLALVSVEVT